jgi:hypothetical protein
MTSGLQEYQSFHINIKMIRALCSSA